LALLPLILLIPALYALASDFDGLYGQDPFAYYNYATGPLRAALEQPAPPPPFHWPPGYPLLVALASYLVGTRPLTGQLISLLAGALVPLFTALLAHEVWPKVGRATRPREVAIGHTAAPDTGRVSDAALPDPTPISLYAPLVAGLLIACCGQLWQSSIVVMSDTTGLAAAIAGVWVLLRYSRHRRAPWFALAAALLAYAILTRWAYALVALPCTLYVLWLLFRAAPTDRRRALLHALVATAVACAVLSPILPPALDILRQRSPQPAAHSPQFTADLQVYRWHPLTAFRREHTTADGHLTYPWANGLYYATLLARPLYFTPLLALVALPGLWRIARRPTPPLLLLIGWIAVVAGFHAGAPWQNVRFALAYTPPCAILIAFGLATLWERRDRRLTVAANAILTFGLAWMLAGNLPLLDRFIDRKEADLAVARAIAVPPDARLLTFGLTLTLRRYTPYPTHDLSEQTPATLATLLADNRPTYLLLDVPNIETQWHNRAPQRNYHRLRDDPGLTPIAQHGPYTLFQVGPAALGPRHVALVTRHSP
jgi:hypothetical protein